MGGWGQECSQFHQSLADKISHKTGEPYSKAINMIRCKLSFLLLRAAILCVRGSRSTYGKKLSDIGNDFTLYSAELQLHGH